MLTYTLRAHVRNIKKTVQQVSILAMILLCRALLIPLSGVPNCTLQQMLNFVNILELQESLSFLYSFSPHYTVCVGRDSIEEFNIVQLSDECLKFWDPWMLKTVDKGHIIESDKKHKRSYSNSKSSSWCKNMEIIFLQEYLSYAIHYIAVLSDIYIYIHVPRMSSIDVTL